MAKYYITSRTCRATNKKVEAINELLEGYDGALVTTDHLKDCIVENVKEYVDTYNEIKKGKPNYVTLSAHPTHGGLIVAVHTENSDITSEIVFHLVTREIDK